MLRPPPPQMQMQMQGPPQNAQWQWSSGRPGDAGAGASASSAQPVKFSIAPPPRALAPPPRPVFAPAPAGAGAPGIAAGNTKWPDSLHEYVKRAFARCKGAADQALTQNALKDLITNAITTNSLWTRNWVVEPLPTLVGDAPVAKMHHSNVVMNGPPPPPFNPRPVKVSKQNTVGSESYIAFNPTNAVAKKSKAAKRKLYVAVWLCRVVWWCCQWRRCR